MSTILGLDIGTEYVKAIMAKPGKKGNLEILGIGKAKQKDGNMHAGAIADIPAVISTCEQALVQVEDKAGERADQVVVGIAGELVKGNTTTVHYTRKNPNKPISEAEMNDIIKKVQVKSGEVAKKMVALETGNDNIEVRLINSSDVAILIYTAHAPLIHVAAIEKVCAELNLDLLAVAVEPFAVCRACLGDDPDSSFSGIVMDIGGGTTDIAVVDDGGVEGTKMFSIGGRSFTHQIAEALGTDFDTAEEQKLKFDTGELDDRVKAKIETAISKNISVWLTGVEVALEEFESFGSLPRSIMLCGGGASLSMVQETLATSDWFESLPFSRRPIIHLIDINELPNYIIKDFELDHSFATALGLLRVGADTLAGAPPENKLKAKIAKLLQN